MLHIESIHIRKNIYFCGKIENQTPTNAFYHKHTIFFYIWEVLYEYYFQSIKSKAKLQFFGLQLVHFTVRIITL